MLARRIVRLVAAESVMVLGVHAFEKRCFAGADASTGIHEESEPDLRHAVRVAACRD
jgi:hypothetical protein